MPYEKQSVLYITYAIIPRWVSKMALGLGLVNKVSWLFSGDYVKTLQSVVQRLTKNKDLQTVLCYAWGDFGTEPSKASFLMMADLNNHFLKNGAFYPVHMWEIGI